MPRFLSSGAVRLASILLLAQAALLYSSIRPEAVPPSKPLSGFPKELGAWRLYKEGVVEPEVMEVLKADDVLTRDYVGAGQATWVNLFVAAFRSQRTGKAPHSPKNCLPGNGWTQLDSRNLAIDVGQAQPIVVNRYEIQNAEQRSLTLYWYQSRDRVVANEYKAKFWVVADAIRLNRTDTALVRVIVPIVAPGMRPIDSETAERAGVNFIQASYASIRSFLPN
jgi:EpsI family protein